MGKKKFENCTILRRVEVNTYTFNIVTGKKTHVSSETVIENCNTPLFTEQERITGICKSCRSGYATRGNEFANESELQRAIK